MARKKGKAGLPPAFLANIQKMKEGKIGGRKKKASSTTAKKTTARKPAARKTTARKTSARKTTRKKS